MTSRRASISALWFPIVLCAIVLGNVIAGVAYHRATRATAPYILAIREDDSLISTTRGVPGQFFKIWTQLYELQLALGGAEVAIPEDLALDPLPWRMLGLVALREHTRRPILRRVERVLRAEAHDPPIPLNGRLYYVARDLHPPWNAPLELVVSRQDETRVYVVSPERLDRQPFSDR